MSTAATVVPDLSSQAPGEEELQSLYDAVWDAFRDEPPTASDADINDLYYTPESAVTANGDNPLTSNANSPTSPASFSKYPPQHEQPAPAQKPRQTSKAFRPLPQIPGSSSSPMSPPSAILMPEPDPYDGAQRFGAESYNLPGSSDLLRNVTTGSTGSGRKLPTAPGHTGRSPSATASDAIPPYYQRSSSDIPSATRYSDQTGYNNISHDPSRPPGASPPRDSSDIDDYYGSYGTNDDGYSKSYGSVDYLSSPPAPPPMASGSNDHVRNYSDHKLPPSGGSSFGMPNPSPYLGYPEQMDRSMSGSSFAQSSSMNGYPSSPTTYLVLSVRFTSMNPHE
ncbi:hypothetical protein ONZ45_g16770 [Pleurotus djamor]|nr:hypothetical protein ONZ45_g16770 [Pleurotus djamor]